MSFVAPVFRLHYLPVLDVTLTPFHQSWRWPVQGWSPLRVSLA